MTDVFVSYSHQDREIADRLVARLKARGWTVYWDPHLRTGDEWKETVEAKVREACTVVVLFSTAASRSQWVRAEAAIGKERGVLLPVLLDMSQPPDDFSMFQGSNLAGWDGTSEPTGLLDLVHAIAARCGSHESVQLRPLQLFLVVGWPTKLPSMGATVNMNCRMENHLKTTASIRFVEAAVTGPKALSYTLTWTVPYDAVGVEHSRRFEPTPAIDVPPGGITRGVQVQAAAFSERAAWPPGEYTFDILGWTTHTRREPANLRTRCKVRVSAPAAGQVQWLQHADDATWASLKATDDAMGVEVDLTEVRVGVPVVD
jgi:hypothetical protein